MQQKFTDSFDSLQQRTIPDWFRDAKFGIWSHWGPQSVAHVRRLVRPQYVHSVPPNITTICAILDILQSLATRICASFGKRKTLTRRD